LYIVGCVSVLLVALFLRVYALGSQSFWIDEISVTSFVRSGHLLSDLRDRGGPFEPPLHYLTVLGALHLPFGFETAARIPSVLFGTLEVGALILLTREATTRRSTALVAGLLLAVAPFAVRYSQENRYYVMFSALALLSWWLLLRSFRLESRGSWAWYGVVAALMQLTHPFAPLVLLLEAIVVGVMLWGGRGTERPKAMRRGYGLAIVIGVVLIAPWYVYGALKWIPNALDGKSYALNPSGQFAVPLDTDLFKRGAEWLLGNAQGFDVLAGILVILAIAAPFLARGRERVVAASTLAYVLIFVLVLVPLARALGTYFAYRRIESLVAPLLLVVAVALVAAGYRLFALHLQPRVAVGVGVVAVLVVAGLALSATISYYSTEKTNYRAFAREVRDAPGGRAIVVGSTTRRAAGYIRDYLHWKGVDRPVTFLVPGHRPPPIAVTPQGVLWLTGAPPDRSDMTTKPLNDLAKMQVIAGDRSGLLIILPWFASTSHPTSEGELGTQRDAIAQLPPFLPAP
jgi:4-amino-4-deoxy-L-arabinose transferase-like glycosyltransferase